MAEHRIKGGGYFVCGRNPPDRGDRNSWLNPSAALNAMIRFARTRSAGRRSGLRSSAVKPSFADTMFVSMQTFTQCFFSGWGVRASGGAEPLGGRAEARRRGSASASTIAATCGANNKQMAFKVTSPL